MSSSQRRIAFDTAATYDTYRQRQHRNDATQRWAAALAFSKTISDVVSSGGDSHAILQERALWDLLSLFCLEMHSSLAVDNMLPDLPRWLRTNNAALVSIPVPHQQQQNATIDQQKMAIRDSPIPEDYAAYWTVLGRCVALGWIDDALELLGLHSAWISWGAETDGTNGESIEMMGGSDGSAIQIAALEAVTLLLRRFPVIVGRGAAGGTTAREFDSVSEYNQYRAAWVAQCAQTVDNDNLWNACSAVAPDAAEHLKRIVEAMSGRASALAVFCSTWCELLIAQLTHHTHLAGAISESMRDRIPLQTLPQLRDVIHRCVADSPPGDNEFLHVLAGVMDACCDNDMQSAMRACSVVASEWFMAHIPCIIEMHPAAGDVLSKQLPHLGASQTEFYTLEYAAALALHPATWSVAASYLAWCISYGHEACMSLLLSLPYDAADDKLVMRAVTVGAERGLGGFLASLLYQIQGTLCWQDGLVGASLSWLGKAMDGERSDAVLQQLVDAPDEERRRCLDEMKEYLEAAPMESKSAVLLKVRSMLCDGVNLTGAIELLRQLPATERDACLYLVWDVIPSMIDPGKLESKDIMQLLEWIEVSESHGGNANTTMRLALVRLAAARHMQSRS